MVLNSNDIRNDIRNVCCENVNSLPSYNIAAVLDVNNISIN